jgi:hypothetical protein
MVSNSRKPLTVVQDKQIETYTVDLVLVVVVEENHTIECPTLMLWLLLRQACGVKAFVFTHQNGPQWPQTSNHWVQDKQIETYTVDLAMVVEEKHPIEYPTLMMWLLTRQACGVKAFVFTYQNKHQRP